VFRVGQKWDTRGQITLRDTDVLSRLMGRNRQFLMIAAGAAAAQVKKTARPRRDVGIVIDN
jgi:hypothetical protein